MSIQCLYLILHLLGRVLFQGVMAIMPLSIAVIPWGFWQVRWLSMQVCLLLKLCDVFVGFAGAAQLVSLSLVMEGINTDYSHYNIFLTSQHFIYALTFRNNISVLPVKQRLPLGFLLTDELFAVSLSPENVIQIIC